MFESSSCKLFKSKKIKKKPNILYSKKKDDLKTLALL